MWPPLLMVAQQPGKQAVPGLGGGGVHLQIDPLKAVEMCIRDRYCTTLSISPMKDPIRLNDLGTELGKQYGVPFLPSEDVYKRQTATAP